MLLRSMARNEKDPAIKESFIILGLSLNQLIDEGDIYIKDSYDDESVRDILFERYFKCQEFVENNSLEELIDIT